MTICKKCEFKEKGTLSGQGFRDFTCVLCGKTDTWCNTNVPRFCYECSKKLNICQRCGEILEEE